MYALQAQKWKKTMNYELYIKIIKLLITGIEL